jgi:hypothetical protein
MLAQILFPFLHEMFEVILSKYTYNNLVYASFLAHEKCEKGSVGLCWQECHWGHSINDPDVWVAKNPHGNSDDFSKGKNHFVEG